MARLKKRRKGVSSGKPRIGKRKQPRGNSSVMGKWNSRLTPRENYNKLGILGHVNQTAGNVVEKAGGGSSDNGEWTSTCNVFVTTTEGDKWLDDGRLVPQEAKTRGKKLLSDDEHQYAARLVAKHGCDFRSMVLDHVDANPNQLSQGKCKSLVKKFLALGKVDMPLDLLAPE